LSAASKILRFFRALPCRALASRSATSRSCRPRWRSTSSVAKLRRMDVHPPRGGFDCLTRRPVKQDLCIWLKLLQEIKVGQVHRQDDSTSFASLNKHKGIIQSILLLTFVVRAKSGAHTREDTRFSPDRSARYYNSMLRNVVYRSSQGILRAPLCFIRRNSRTEMVCQFRNSNCRMQKSSGLQ